MGKKFNFEFVPLTRGQIKEMSSSELSFHISKFRRFIREAINVSMDTVSFETELCYLDRERQARESLEKGNRQKHNAFQEL